MNVNETGTVFLVDWYDPVATMTKQYMLFYYEKDSSVEMFDPKNRRIFLKRSYVENVLPSDFFIGNSVNVLSRQLRIVGYGDAQTQKKIEIKSEKTFIIVKPDAFCKIGQILDIFYKCGYQIIRMKSFILSRQDSIDFFEKYGDATDQRVAIAHFSSGPIAVVELMGENIMTRAMSIIGPAEPSQARASNPNSIRAKFGTDLVANAVDSVTTFEMKRYIEEFFFNCDHKIKNSILFDNSTCVLIKPHAIAEAKAGEIITRIVECGFELTAIGLHKLDKVNVEEFLEVYRGVVPEYPQMVVELASGPCIAIEARGQDAVRKKKKVPTATLR